MSKRFKNMLLMGMIASLVLIPASVTRAADLPETESEEEMRERVYEEVLTGEITNDEDVIKVALEQYHERMNHRSRIGSPELLKDDGSLSITQVLDTYTNENGNVIEDVVTTGLLVLDDNNNLVRGSMVSTGSAGLTEYSIYASMNVSVTYDSSAGKVRFNWFDTKLTYGTAMTAGKLTQSSTYAPEPFFIYNDVTKQISYPQGNVTYRYTPSNTVMIEYMRIFCGRTCTSNVNVGSRYFILGYDFTSETCNQNKGTWETEYH